MNYDWSFGIVARYAGLLWTGTLYTLLFTAITVLLGLLLGVTIGSARLSNVRAITWPLTALTECFRCTPILVQLIWFYYALPVLLDINIPAVVAATAVLSFYGASFYSEIFRGGIKSIEKGQWEASRALGIGRWHMMMDVIMPQAIRRMIAPFMNQSVTQMKNTALVSTIAVPDLLYQGTVVTAETYRPLEVYTTVAVIYFLLLFPTTRLVHALELYMARHEAR